MLNLEEIKARLATRDLARVAKETGMSRATVKIVADDHTANPTYTTLKALSDWLEANP